MEIRKEKVTTIGSCNFCNGTNEYVYEMSGKTLVVRICISCAFRLKEYIKYNAVQTI